MRHLKALTLGLLFCGLGLSLASCGNNEATDSTTKPGEIVNPTPEATPEPTPEATPEPTPEATPEPTPEPVKKFILTLKGADKFAGNVDTLELEEGTILSLDSFAAREDGLKPTAIAVLGENDSVVSTHKMGSYKVTANETIKVAAYTVPAGFKELDPGSEQNDRTPQVYGKLNRDNFTNSGKLDTVINGGEGLGHLGSVISYTGTMAKDDHFRLLTVVDSNNKVVLRDVEHQFLYNIENKGDSKISLTLNQVNSGTNIEAFPAVDIVLNPGESISFIIKATFKNGGDNKNCMAYFGVKEEMNNMKLGISIAVKLGTK